MERVVCPALLRAALAALLSCVPGILAGLDCDGNGIEDAFEIREGSAPDCNLNGRIDPCELVRSPGILEPRTEVGVNAAWPSFLQVTDFDGDGRLNAIVSDRFGISVLRGGPDGFLPSRAYTPPGWRSVAFSAGDWSGDGLVDLAAIVSLGDGLRIWRNTGDGFEPVDPPEQTPEWQQGVLIEDMNLDGSVDLIEAGEFAVRIHWNAGGAWTRGFTDLGQPYWGFALRVVDANGDGGPDLGLDFPKAGFFGLFLNEGGQSFAELVTRGFPVETQAMALGDLDGDGKTDLLAQEHDGRMVPRSILDMSALREGFFPRAHLASFIAADLDGDGADDPVLIHEGEHCDGSASWLEVRRSSEDWAVPGTTASIPGSLTGPYASPRVAEAGDVDGDGDLDLVVLAGAAEGSPRVVVLENAPAAEAQDMDADGVPDGCAGSDCNGNGAPDSRDIAIGASLDCDRDGLPDECEPDCNANGDPDDCDLIRGASLDGDRSGIPDECEDPGDCDLNAISDGIDLASGRGDCDADGVLDACEVGPEVLLNADYVHRTGLRARPRSAVAADLDGDGDLDAAYGGRVECCAAAPLGGSVEVLLNLGDGRLATTGVHRIDGDPLKLAPGDHEGDGDVDLFILEAGSPCRPDARASVLLNRGKGAFERGPMERLPLDAASFASGDLDGDGRTDLALGSPLETGGCVILLRSRAGHLDETTVGPEGGATAVAAGDWDRDGFVDLVAASAAGESLYVLVGEAGGAFTLGSEISDAGARPAELLSRDFDGDADLDLVRRESELVDYPGEYRFLAGDGKGSFTLVFQAYLRSSSVLFEDMDGDLVNDLIVVGPAPTIGPTWTGFRLYRGPVREEMLSPRDLWDPGVFVGAGPVLPLAGDWNADGSVDILLADIDARSAALLRNSGTESRFFTATHMETGSEALSLEAADLDGDGDPDLVQVSGVDLRVAVNRGGVFVGGEPMALPSGVKALSTGDLDLDGAVDLVLAAPFRVVLLLNQDKGSSFDSRSIAVGSDPVAVVVMDLEADGDLDIATANGLSSRDVSDNVTVLGNLGDGEYETGRNYASGFGNTGIAAADMDSDGDPDLVVSVSRFPYPGFLLRNDGNGAFGSPERLYDGSSRPPLLGDVDGDGDTDVVTADGLFLNHGDGSVVPGQRLLSVYETVMRLLDVEGDGDPDLVLLRGYGQHWLEVRRNDGRGIFGQSIVQDAGQSLPPPGATTPGSSTKPSAIAPADFDLDGDPDLALGFLERSWITVVWNRTPRAEPDLDGDGVPDGCATPPARFRRGDTDGSGSIELTDAVGLLRRLFLSGEAIPCEKSADADDSGGLDLTDAIRILSHLFLGGQPPPAPYEACGSDPTADELACGPVPGCG